MIIRVQGNNRVRHDCHSKLPQSFSLPLAPKGQSLPYMFYCTCLPHIHLRGNSPANQPATILSIQFTPIHTAYPPSRLSSLTNFVHHPGKCTDTLINHQCTLGQTSLIFTPTITVAFAAHHLLLCCAPFHLLVRTKTSSGAQRHQQSIKGQTPLTQ